MAIIQWTVTKETTGEKKTSRSLNLLLNTAGIILVGVGIVGIFVPILPTTPFLLLAAACFIRSSDRLYKWLLSNRIFGEYLKNYMEKKGIPIGVKIFTILFLWTTILISVILFINNIWIDGLMIIIALGVTLHLIMIKTHKGPPLTSK